MISFYSCSPVWLQCTSSWTWCRVKRSVKETRSMGQYSIFSDPGPSGIVDHGQSAVLPVDRLKLTPELRSFTERKMLALPICRGDLTRCPTWSWIFVSSDPKWPLFRVASVIRDMDVFRVWKPKLEPIYEFFIVTVDVIWVDFSSRLQN